jgi:hypothetical protein
MLLQLILVQIVDPTKNLTPFDYKCIAYIFIGILCILLIDYGVYIIVIVAANVLRSSVLNTISLTVIILSSLWSSSVNSIKDSLLSTKGSRSKLVVVSPAS